MIRRAKSRTPAVKSLGPSNDDSPEVQVEMRAAELASDWDPPSGPISGEEYAGWSARHRDDVALDGDERLAGWLAGWLSREIRYAGTERDIGTWAWDISRPIAEQLVETAADDVAADALGIDLDGAR